MMQKMKDSGIEWIKDIPYKWDVYKGKYLFSNNKKIVGAKVDDYDRLALTLNGVIKRSKFDNNGLQPDDFSSYQILKKDELVFKLIDLQNVSTSRVGLSPYDGIVSPAYIVLKPNKKMYAGYAEKYFLSMWLNEIFNALGDSGVRSSLNASEIMNLYMPVPPYDEQIKISSFLDKKIFEIDSTINNLNIEIENLEQYRRSFITKVITKGLNKDAKFKDSGIKWIGDIPVNFELIKIKNIAEYRNGLTYSPLNIVDEDEGTLVLRSSNVQKGKIVLNDNVYVKANIKKNLKVKKGDILICSRNGSRELIGKNAIIETDLDASFGAFMMICRCSNPKYLYYILNSNIFTYYLGSFFTSTINQLTGDNFGNMKVVYCKNINVQNDIVSYLDSKCSNIDSLIDEVEIQKENLLNYKKSLMFEYVTGKKEIIL